MAGTGGLSQAAGYQYPASSPNGDFVTGVRNVPYKDLTGGLNTKKDPHALSRNQLSQSINCWYSQGNSISKRPGNAAFVTVSGATGSGSKGIGIGAARFSNISYTMEQSGDGSVRAAKPADTSYANIGTVSTSSPMHVAQIYDATQTANVAIVVDGVSTPQYWKGPTTTMGTVTTTALPTKFDGTGHITPAYVTTFQNHLVYAGEPTCMTAVYISDAFQPESFTGSIYSTTPYGGTYQPLLVGFNDGVSGGDITGIEPIFNSLMVYKQSAIYRMDNVSVEGDLVLGSTSVSVSVGCLSPRSIVKFDTFHLFLGIDGVYQTDGATTKRISDNVPTYFDGPTAAIQDRTSAVAVRYGQRYMIWFDDGNGTNTAVGHPTTGLWFDFAKLDEDGYPTVGQISGMQPAGVVSLRGPADTGTFVWCDAVQDRVGQFGLGSSDFGGAISVAFSGKNDMFDDIFGIDASLHTKHLDQYWLLLSLPQMTFGQTLTYTVSGVFDSFTTNSTNIQNIFVPTFSTSGNQVGTAIVGTAVVSGSTTATSYQVVPGYPQEPSNGFVIGLQISETSIYPWTCLGYILGLNVQQDTPT